MLRRPCVYVRSIIVIARGLMRPAGGGPRAPRWRRRGVVREMTGLAAVKVELDVEGLPAPPLPDDAPRCAGPPSESPVPYGLRVRKFS
jgi:hypothetical protein